MKIYLPRLAERGGRADAGAEPAHGRRTPARARAGETILLVEDNDGVREYARAL